MDWSHMDAGSGWQAQSSFQRVSAMSDNLPLSTFVNMVTLSSSRHQDLSSIGGYSNDWLTNGLGRSCTTSGGPPEDFAKSVQMQRWTHIDAYRGKPMESGPLVQLGNEGHMPFRLAIQPENRMSPQSGPLFQPGYGGHMPFLPSIIHENRMPPHRGPTHYLASENNPLNSLPKGRSQTSDIGDPQMRLSKEPAWIELLEPLQSNVPANKNIARGSLPRVPPHGYAKQEYMKDCGSEDSYCTGNDPVRRAYTCRPQEKMDAATSSSHFGLNGSVTVASDPDYDTHLDELLSDALSVCRNTTSHYEGFMTEIVASLTPELDNLIQNQSCTDKFKHQNKLAQHHYAHEGGTVSRCSGCARQFQSLPELLEHRVTCDNSVGRLCLRCNKIFVTRTKLDQHYEDVHSLSIVYACRQCSKKFRTVRAISEHVQVTRCGKFFRSKAILASHTEVHSNDKPFECLHCKRKYKHRSSLTRHMGRFHVRFFKFFPNSDDSSKLYRLDAI